MILNSSQNFLKVVFNILLIYFNGMSIRQGLFYVKRLRNHVHIYIFVSLFKDFNF